MKPQPLNDHDRRVLETQLGRPPRGDVFAAARCPFGEVEVVATAPLLDGEEPFPTLYWLTCPLLKSEVGRLEAGEMRELLRARMRDEGFARELAEAEAEYLKDRREMARSLGMEQAEELFEGRNGVAGGPAGNLKCLHSHFAHWLARGSNPVGREMAGYMSPVQTERSHCPCNVVASEAKQPKNKYASIDAGTNSTRLLLAEMSGAKDRPLLRTLERRMAITRMGKGVDAEGRLSQAGLDRTRRVLEDYARVIRESGGVRHLEVAGTSAARDAANASAFTDMVLNILGVEPRVLSGEEEARLSFTGATYDLPQASEAREKQAPILVVDIGGGSTEFVLGQGAGQLYRRSVDVGCVRMSERFLASDPPREGEIVAMRETVEAALEPVLKELRGREITLMIGLAGTVTTLSAMRMDLNEYDGERIHGSRLTREEVSGIFREMAARDLEGRKAYMGLEPERADVILGGTMVLECILAGLGLNELLVSEKDILDGLVIEAWSEGLDPV